MVLKIIFFIAIDILQTNAAPCPGRSSSLCPSDYPSPCPSGYPSGYPSLCPSGYPSPSPSYYPSDCPSYYYTAPCPSVYSCDQCKTNYCEEPTIVNLIIKAENEDESKPSPELSEGLTKPGLLPYLLALPGNIANSFRLHSDVSF